MPARSIYWEEYVLRTVEQYKGKINTWVVWDRPDSEVLNATAQEFTDKMLSVAYKAAKEADPNIKLISGGITRDNMDKYLIAMAGNFRRALNISMRSGFFPRPRPSPPRTATWMSRSPAPSACGRRNTSSPI